MAQHSVNAANRVKSFPIAPGMRRTDRILKAEELIDEVIAEWEVSMPVGAVMSIMNVRAGVREVFHDHGYLHWFLETFSERGWDALIQTRLGAAGFKRFHWGWGRNEAKK